MGLRLAHLGPNWAQIWPENGFLANIFSLVHLILLILNISIDCNDVKLLIEIFSSVRNFWGSHWPILGLELAKNGVLADISILVHLPPLIIRILIDCNDV